MYKVILGFVKQLTIDNITYYVPKTVKHHAQIYKTALSSTFAKGDIPPEVQIYEPLLITFSSVYKYTHLVFR